MDYLAEDSLAAVKWQGSKLMVIEDSCAAVEVGASKLQVIQETLQAEMKNMQKLGITDDCQVRYIYIYHNIW